MNKIKNKNKIKIIFTNLIPFNLMLFKAKLHEIFSIFLSFFFSRFLIDLSLRLEFVPLILLIGLEFEPVNLFVMYYRH